MSITIRDILYFIKITCNRLLLMILLFFLQIEVFAKEHHTVSDHSFTLSVKAYNEDPRGQQGINYALNEAFYNITIDTSQIKQKVRQANLIIYDKPDSAIVLLKEALRKSVAIGYESGIISALRDLGLIYNDFGYYEKSLQCFESALVYAKKAHYEHSSIAQIYMGITSYQLHVGRYDSAAYYIYKALNEIEYSKKTNHDIILIFNNVAAFWIIMDNTKKALYYLEKAEDLAIKYKDTCNLATAMLNKSNIYSSNKQWDSAMFYCQKTITLCKRANKFKLQTTILNEATLGAGVIHIEMNQPQEAIPWLQQAVKQFKQIKDQANLIISYYNLGNAYYQLHDYKKAEKIMLMVCLQSQNIGVKSEERANAHGFLASIYRQNRNYQKAFSEMEKYHQINDSLLTKEKTQVITQLDVKYRVAEKDKALAEKQLQLLKQQNNLKEKNFWIIGISVGSLLLAISLIALYRSNSHKQGLQNVMINNLQQAQEISQLKARMEGEEKERTRLARELHDGIGGMLASIKMNLNSVKKEYP